MIGKMPSTTWTSGRVDINTPSVARVYDYYLGGSHNFAADREFAKEAIRKFPAAPDLARRNRNFLQRAVRVLAGRGCRQFLDLGSGIPTAGHVHQIAGELIDDPRVVYVDNEAVAIEHSKIMTADIEGVEAVYGDFKRPDRLLQDPVVRSTLDFDEPIAVIFCAALHLVPDEDDPWSLVAAYRDATVAGSHLAISHGTLDNREDLQALVQHYSSGVSNRFIVRTRAECEALFPGYELLEPGVVFTDQWYPEHEVDQEEASRSGVYAGVGRKPA